MAFTSFNLSRFNSVFRRAVAAFGFGTDSAIRARVQEEAAGSAVWARFAPSVAGYPVLPRVAGNLQIDEPAALTALAGSADLLSYTAPVFKAGHTLPPLTCFAPTFFERVYSSPNWSAKDGDGGIGADLADNWGFCIELGRGLPSTWASSDFETDIANPHSQAGCVVDTINSNPGRWKIACVTRSFLSWEDTSVTEAIFVDESGGGASDGYMVNGVLAESSSAAVCLPGGSIMNVVAGGGTDYTAVFAKVDGVPLRSWGRVQLKPYWCYSDASSAGGTSVPSAKDKFVAEEMKLITAFNNALTTDKLSVVRNGQEYQPVIRGNNALTRWTKNRSVVVGEMLRNDDGGTDRAYVCITAGTTENTDGAGPKGTSSDITDGTAHWKYVVDTNVSWRVDPDSRTWLDTIDTYSRSIDADNISYNTQLSGARVESETALKTAMNAVSPSLLYIYYSNLDIKEGYYDSGPSPGLHSGSIRSGMQWGYPQSITGGITDLPSPELYRGYFISWTSNGHGTNAYGSLPELTLNAAHSCIASGAPLMYPFVSGGWSSGGPPNYISYDDQWMGYLKFLFTAGALSVDYGFYGTPDTTHWTLDATAAPEVRHALCVGHVQATFSHLENYLRSGTLLDGDYDARGKGHSSHWMSDDLYGRHTRDFPSYEFVHDDDDQLYSKVIARKLDASNDWLICAWRCLDSGTDRIIHSTIAGHALTLNARRGGTLYHMDNAGTLTMLDPLSMDPSRTIAAILAGL